MKIEPSRNHQTDKKESKNVYKSETSVFARSVKNDAPPPPPGVFARILEETRRENERTAPKRAAADAPDANGAPEKTEKDGKAELRDGRRARERDAREGDAETSSQNDDNRPPGQSANPGATRGAAHSESAPAARSILHVADLERLVATIRTDNFLNRKQVVIALRHSVLEGLLIKLTLTENGRVQAEFQARSESVRQKLRQRKKELEAILGRRSPLFEDIAVAAPEE